MATEPLTTRERQRYTRFRQRAVTIRRVAVVHRAPPAVVGRHRVAVPCAAALRRPALARAAHDRTRRPPVHAVEARGRLEVRVARVRALQELGVVLGVRRLEIAAVLVSNSLEVKVLELRVARVRALPEIGVVLGVRRLEIAAVLVSNSLGVKVLELRVARVKATPHTEPADR